MNSNMECGASAPLSSGPPRRPNTTEPRLARQCCTEAQHSIQEADIARWHHAPIHVLLEQGVYMVTAGTYKKENFFQSPERRTLLLERLKTCSNERQWELQAWAVMTNHYHFIALSPADPSTLRRVLNKLHMTTAKAVNELDNMPGRKVWHEFWETRLTFERSYLARLHYVNQNPTHHKLTQIASNYHWCSAAHFERHISSSFQRTINAMPIDKLEIQDDF